MIKEKQNLAIKLESLIDLSNKLNETYNENFILNAILLSLMGKLKLTKASIFIPDTNSKKLILAISKGKTNIDTIDYFEITELHKLSNHNNIEETLLDDGFQWLQPIIYKNQMLALICLGKKMDSESLTDYEIQYSKLVSMISSNAIQNSRNHNKLIKAKSDLEKQNQLLSTFFEISRDFSVLLTKSQIIKMLSYRLMGQLMVTRFAVVHFYDNNKIDILINRFNKNLDLEILKELSKIKTISFLNTYAFSTLTTRKLLEMDAKICSPMLLQGDTKGLLLIGKKMNYEEFTNENLLFIEALGNIAISALENERLFREEIEKKKMENEMLLALEIQKKLLPATLPEVKGFQIFGLSQPSRLVGGDYFDFIEVADGKYLVTIADVSGKGMPAALLMANVQAVLRVLAPLSISLKELIHRLNTIVYQNTSADKFVTFFCGYLDTNLYEFEYINAGHNPPIFIVNNKEIRYLNEGGLILGISENPFEYEIGKIKLPSNSQVIFYTDGVTEALAENNEEYGIDRLINIVLKSYNNSPKEISELIISDVYNHIQGAIQDDLTLIIIKTLNNI